MFETFPESRIPSPPFFDGNTIEWDFVTLSLDLPWFYVSWGFRSSTKPCEAKVDVRFISSISLLRLHLEESDPEYFVQDIQLVSPGWLNQSERTQMEPLVRLISYKKQYPGVIKTMFAYEVAGGIRYPIGLDWESLQSATTIFDHHQLQNF
ncbi:hypothetical protein HX817_10810 [Pseudomonas sp. C6002]|uniref:hypothetical protein n=1 Tax=Pseudomonas sp. C6002 TaxID=2738814 RepID=UPI0015A3664B|nr:hypothetical protein [Pseudomonas sp. C6002]NWA32027.1 hypothetical protein [Pseudomonas sp. C6002]